MKDPLSTDQTLSAFLARRIFEAPKVGTVFDRVQRISFKGGDYPDKETDMGGLSEGALAVVIMQALQEYEW